MLDQLKDHGFDVLSVVRFTTSLRIVEPPVTYSLEVTRGVLKKQLKQRIKISRPVFHHSGRYGHDLRSSQ